MAQKSKINASGVEISVIDITDSDNSYISLTDIAKYKNSEDPRVVITNWMSSYSTIDFLAVWEEIHNLEDFNRLEFQSVRNERGRLIMTPKQWIERMQAKGIKSKAGKYGGTYAHSDIAFEFASWISPEFKLYIIKDYQRLKKDEAERKAIGWDEKRALTKLNYHIHTDAVQTYLITDELTSEEKTYTFANEADLLNVALFGKRATDWRKEHPEEAKKGENIRDYASAEELIVLINLENFNAEWISQGLTQQERLQKLRSVAFRQTEILQKNAAKRKLGNVNPNLLKGGDPNAD
ncbi:KilA-N domain-containing protein [Oribacterium sp. WCC10]|uniref:KilA-N domain-containing protein n=1 Tax=Oribacterium sp. WCC10 TaxID=1855343 RepID=UPI0008E1FB78|nr:KilA-N domain-containing protein [Oribacterium sp. WCC10]SFG06509.1 KilA-N domain-containing protein [Oribacterium sp. WCC10]